MSERAGRARYRPVWPILARDPRYAWLAALRRLLWGDQPAGAGSGIEANNDRDRHGDLWHGGDIMAISASAESPMRNLQNAAASSPHPATTGAAAEAAGGLDNPGGRPEQHHLRS